MGGLWPLGITLIGQGVFIQMKTRAYCPGLAQWQGTEEVASVREQREPETKI